MNIIEDTGAGLRELAVAAWLCANYGSALPGMTAQDWLDEARDIIALMDDPIESLREGVSEGLGNQLTVRAA